MKIGIDAVAANKQIRTGVEGYAFKLLQTMKTTTTSEDEVVLYLNEPLNAEWGELPSNWSVKVLAWPLTGWSTFRLNFELLMNKPDVLFLPSSVVPKFAASRGNRSHGTVTTIHDIGFMRTPKVYSANFVRRLRSSTKRAIKKCEHLISVSEFTKNELVDVYKIDQDRITATPLAVDTFVYKKLTTEEIAPVLRKHRLGKHYFLYVSRIDKKKNVQNLIRAFEIFKKGRGFGDPHELVLAGPEGYGSDEIKSLTAASSMKDQIYFLGAVSEEDKVALYNGALGFVNLSWYEGFGLTPLEAAACGTPSLLSDIGAHREVMQDAAMYVIPNEADTIGTAMKRFAEQGTVRDELAIKAQARVVQYSWEKTARLTWEVLRGVIAPVKKFEK